VKEAIERMFTGDGINETEGVRPSRGPEDIARILPSMSTAACMPEVECGLGANEAFSDAVISGNGGLYG